MRPPVQIIRPQRRAHTARRVARPVGKSRSLARSDIAVPDRHRLATALPSLFWAGFQPYPYVDYGRFLTPEGGILFVYKDVDERLLHELKRAVIWALFSLPEGWFLLSHSPLRSMLLNIMLFLAIAVVNLLIVSKPVEVYRSVEIRPDCMIIERAEIFWLRYMEAGWPAFREGSGSLCGIYGSRFVEYLTVRAFDEFDKAPEVFAAHLQEAMQQLWTIPR